MYAGFPVFANRHVNDGEEARAAAAKRKGILPLDKGTLTLMAAETTNTAGTPYRVGIIGTGRPRSAPDYTGWGMSHKHAQGYNATGKCKIVALCDVVREKAEKFNEEHADNQAAIFEDYRQLLSEAKPDIVSVCTWPVLHGEMVIAAAESGVKAIHCEKPMAPTWAEARRMAEVCKANGVQLTFNHQRRFLEAFQTAKNLVKDGAIGQLLRLEGACDNMMDWGTHWLNMFSFYNDDVPAKWVMAQVDVKKPKFVYGVPHDTQGVTVVGYENEVTGTLYTGEFSGKIVGCSNRLIGTEGWIEVHNEAPNVRLRGKGDTELRPAQEVPIEGGLHGDKAITRTIADVVHSLETGQKSLVDVSNALATTELIYATYESARRRGRIDLPLTIDDHPLADMLDNGVFPEAGGSKPPYDPTGRVRSTHLK